MMISITKKHGQLMSLSFCIMTILVLTSYNMPKEIRRTSASVADLVSRTRFMCQRTSSKHQYTFDQNSIVNHLSFSYPIDVPYACRNKTVEIIMPVFSAVANFDRRHRTRIISQGQYTKVKRNRVVMLFFVGLPAHEDNYLQRKLKSESQKFGDIIQMNVTDTYNNLVYKSIAVLDWISQHCSHTDFVLKTDDDVLLFMQRILMKLYKNKFYYSDFIIGDLVANRTVQRSLGSRTYIPRKEYPYSTYPTYIASPVIGLPMSTALLLHQQALRTDIIRFHDVFLTGICAEKVGIPLFHDADFTFVHRMI